MNEQLKTLSDRIQNLGEKIEEIQSVNTVCQNTSDLLVDRIQKLETDLLKAEQYSRRECLDITGINSAVKDDELEDKVCDLLKDIGVNIEKDSDIQACHRYGKKGCVIIKLSNRKKVHEIF